MKNSITILLFLFLNSQLAMAHSEKIISLDPYQKIQLKIGSRSHNRFSFENILIKEIIGDEKLYQIIYPTYKNHFFLLPKSSNQNKIHISVITENNKVQDFELEILDEDGKILIFSKGNI